MADNIDTPVVGEETTTQQSAGSAEIAEMMAIHLNGGIPPQPAEPVITPEASTIGDKGGEQTVDANEYLKTTLGYENWDAAKADIETLRQKAATPTELKFDNEFNEKLFKAIKEGKTQEVYTFLDQQQKIEKLTSVEVNKESAADIIKLGMQFKYKDLTPSEIEYKFNKQFALPKEPKIAIDEDEEDFEVRKTDWQNQVMDIEMNKIIEAKLIRPELENAKSKISLPEITAPIDEDYIQYKKMLEQEPQLNAELSAAYKTFTPKTIETRVPFNDAANKIATEFQYEPDSDSFNKSVEMALDIDKFFDSFKKSDGTPDREGFLSAIHFAINKEKIIVEAMKQAKNATIKASLPDNTQGGMQRISPEVGEPTELEQAMKLALGVNGARRN